MRQIYRVSLMAFLSIGIIGSALMLIIPKQLANMMENPNAMWSIFALGPAVLFVCYISACRGFFQGQGNMGSYGRQPDHRGAVQALPWPRPCLARHEPPRATARWPLPAPSRV